MRSKLVGLAVQILAAAIVISVALLFVGIGTMILIRVCILGRSLRRNVRDSNANAGRGGKSGGNGLSLDELENLPCYEYGAQDEEANGRDDDECSVCLEVFRAGERCRMMPLCEHSFHASCVDSWLLKAAVCPTCRTSAKKRAEVDGGPPEGIQILPGE